MYADANISNNTNILVRLFLWVGVNSRWGSIVSIFVFGWGSISFIIGWGSNQEWGSIRADTVIQTKRVPTLFVSFTK
jgi:hypothetical protein